MNWTARSLISSAVIDYVIDRRAARFGAGHQSERLYTKRLRKRRDVAVSFLLDQSSSTARTIGRHPLQPYTRPGRRIIEIEKEGLVLMSEALEAVGDTYSINGFTSEGRRNVKFYVVKDFDEKYSDEVKQRIGGITFQNNTRLGAAIRHATAKLAKQEARTRLLIVLSDGRPYDHDYGDARYAREDTREALRQAKNTGITPFCITIDRESEAELRDLYGEIGYTIIDDVLSLPEAHAGDLSETDDLRPVGRKQEQGRQEAGAQATHSVKLFVNLPTLPPASFPSQPPPPGVSILTRSPAFSSQVPFDPILRARLLRILSLLPWRIIVALPVVPSAPP